MNNPYKISITIISILGILFNLYCSLVFFKENRLIPCTIHNLTIVYLIFTLFGLWVFDDPYIVFKKIWYWNKE